ncbi:hypothetical protein EDB19DRAFT_1687035 [Suillus lakei]|nr:hypothetical protein EDB19DRAFT_1687035 [Suillus lakei]
MRSITIPLFISCVSLDAGGPSTSGSYGVDILSDLLHFNSSHPVRVDTNITLCQVRRCPGAYPCREVHFQKHLLSTWHWTRGLTGRSARRPQMNHRCTFGKAR